MMEKKSGIGVEEALGLLLGAARGLPAERVSLAGAAGRVLAEEVRAAHDSPPFDTSAMDGFAVRCEELAGAGSEQPVALAVGGEVSAGARSLAELVPGTALRINTGAPLPRGADAVVKIEDVVIEGERVLFRAPVAAGMAIRRAGEDFRNGQVMLAPGRRLDPAAIGLLASLGRAVVSVARRPRVGLLATGDELVEPGEPLGFGQIYNSTRHALIPLLTGFGAEVHDLGTVGDSEEATRAALASGLGFDLLITTGGVSMGSRDLVRPTLAELGVEQLFWRVRQRPGAPIYAGRLERAGGATTLCLGLPGNPVSVFVTALVYARAAIQRMQGVAAPALPWRRAEAAGAFSGAPGLTVFARASLADPAVSSSGILRVVPSPGQGSHQFAALAASTGIVRIAEGTGTIPAGEQVDYLELSDVGA